MPPLTEGTWRVPHCSRCLYIVPAHLVLQALASNPFLRTNRQMTVLPHVNTEGQAELEFEDAVGCRSQGL